MSDDLRSACENKQSRHRQERESERARGQRKLHTIATVSPAALSLLRSFRCCVQHSFARSLSSFPSSSSSSFSFSAGCSSSPEIRPPQRQHFRRPTHGHRHTRLVSSLAFHDLRKGQLDPLHSPLKPQLTVARPPITLLTCLSILLSAPSLLGPVLAFQNSFDSSPLLPF